MASYVIRNAPVFKGPQGPNELWAFLGNVSVPDRYPRGPDLYPQGLDLYVFTAIGRDFTAVAAYYGDGWNDFYLLTLERVSELREARGAFLANALITAKVLWEELSKSI